MGNADALAFLLDLVNSARAPGRDLKIDAPVLSAIVERLACAGSVTPRRLIQVAGGVLSEAAMDLEDGLIKRVDKNYVQEVMEKIKPLIEQTEGEEE
jgi:hypothetical protein